MDRRSLKKTLVERKVYAEGKCARSLETLLELQYMISRALVSSIVKSGRPFNQDLVGECYEQIMGKRHLPAGDKDAFSSINGQSLPAEIKSLYGPPAEDCFVYEQVKGEPAAPPTKPQQSQPLTSSTNDEPFYHVKTAANQVVVQNNDAIEEEDEDVEWEDDEEEENEHKRPRLELE